MPWVKNLPWLPVALNKKIFFFLDSLQKFININGLIFYPRASIQLH
jgi:hypothetical protein